MTGPIRWVRLIGRRQRIDTISQAVHKMSGSRSAFTLIELLVVVSIIALLVSVLLPALSGARRQTRAVKCLAQLRVLGQGLVMYSIENRDVLVPGRLPKVDDCNWFADIAGGTKYRPTFLAMMSIRVGTPPFKDPKTCRNEMDMFGEPGDRQDYDEPIYVCPSVPKWTDERNGSYGYNYQFLGNSRLLNSSDIHSFKNWPVNTTRIRKPSGTVAVADCMGTAASFATRDRGVYVNNARDDFRFGNEGFNLDPPRVDPANGEMAGLSDGHRSAAAPRHRGRANVLWVDGHADANTLKGLGYKQEETGVINFDGSNRLWSGDGQDVPWLQPE